ncbi:FAD-binding oxidoreductase [Pseudonocardia hispaniensis]|uniref:FAD-binding oxidoreductase n=1 Tax=Pseudonocardia hispaniensis TaxID=904933 RepID=A0ABW1J4B2_9PSEU
MTQTASGDIEALRAAMDGPVIAPGDPGYEEARTVWNADIDRRPAVIARCASARDVAAAVTYAQAEGLEIAVRGGAHSMPGASAVDDGLVVDLSRMRAVSVDPTARRARVQGGALLGDLDAATQEHGLAVPTGLVSHTGVGGLTLGGGMGWLTRQAGLTIDNLVSAEIVVADGRVLRAAADENPDLFWAIRGGGGNFGVVTEFEFRLHEVGPMVHFGLFFWGLDQGAEALRLIRDVVPDLPRSQGAIAATALTAPPAPFVPEEHHHKQGYALLLPGFGAAAEHQRVVDRIRAELPPLFDVVEPMPYVALQQLFDEANAWGLHAYEKAAYLTDLTDGAIDVLTEHAPGKSSPLSLMLFYRLDQTYCEVGEADTAFGGGRSPRYAAFLIALCPTPDLLVADRAWVRSVWDALRPHMIDVGSYVNSIHEPDEHRIRASYGPAKYDRLASIKADYDPGNVFHRNANIKPA